MRVTMVTGGSRGDVQPYVALGLGLKERGHEVNVLTYPYYEGMVRDHGLGFSPMSGDPQTILGDLMAAGTNPATYARNFRRVTEPLLETNLEETLSACEGSEAVIYATVGFLGFLAAKELGIPAVSAGLQPLFSPTESFPSSVLFEGRSFGKAYNRLSYGVTRQVFWQTFRPLIEPLVRERLSVSRLPWYGPFGEMDSGRVPCLYGWSPEILPEPDDWGSWNKVTGFWFLERSRTWKPPADLADFLQSGTAPVVIGFSSTSFENREETLTKLQEALRLEKLRAVLLTGWSGFDGASLSEDVYSIEEAPHDWLFPRTRAVVHHGGLGTTGAALRAQVPMVTLPASSDQGFWARRVWRLGSGTKPMSPNSASAAEIAHAMRQAVAHGPMRDRTRHLGARVQSEDGVASAVDIFEQAVERRDNGK